MTTVTKAYDAGEVAKYFIYLSSKKVIGDTGEREGISNLKLQKVLYLAQAYYLSKLNKPLFSDSIEAWKYGPVVPGVYHLYKSNKNTPIIDTKDRSKLSPKDKNVLDRIWDSFGGYSAGKLVDITHADTPWKNAFSSQSRVISNNAIRNYYKPLIGN